MQRNSALQTYRDDQLLSKTHLHRIVTVVPLLNTSKSKKDDKPWMYKGLPNACEKKNTLYKLFLKNRFHETENKYKNTKTN